MSDDRDQEIARLEESRDHAYAQLSEVTSRVLAMSEAATSLVETHDAPSAAAALLDVATRSVAARAGCVFLSHGEGDSQQAGRAIRESALEAVAQGIRTADLGGHASTSDYTDEVIRRVKAKLEGWGTL